MEKKPARIALALIEFERLDRLAEQLRHRFAAHFISHIIGVHIHHLTGVALLRYDLRYSKLGMCSCDNHTAYIEYSAAGNLSTRPARKIPRQSPQLAWR